MHKAVQERRRSTIDIVNFVGGKGYRSFSFATGFAAQTACTAKFLARSWFAVGIFLGSKTLEILLKGRPFLARWDSFDGGLGVVEGGRGFVG